MGKCNRSFDTSNSMSIISATECSLDQLTDKGEVTDPEKSNKNSEMVYFTASPNIAEKVKVRRACNLFKHEGMYANGGEGQEELLAQDSLTKFAKKDLNVVSKISSFHRKLSVSACGDVAIASDQEEDLRKL